MNQRIGGWTRRAFLKAAGATGLSLTTLGADPSGCEGGLDYASLDPRDPLNFYRPLRLPGSSGPMALVDAASLRSLTAGPTNLNLVEGQPTQMWVYKAGLESIINPVIYGRVGDVVDLQMQNMLSDESILHWHGLHVPWQMDGHPSYQVAPGESYAYRFPLVNRGGTYWYHPHTHMATGQQVYMGMNGFFIIEDDDDLRLRAELDLEFGVTDIPLLLQEKRLDATYQIDYTLDEMQAYEGYFGDVNLVNLTVNPTLDVGTRFYRFRILNGCNARTYRLALMAGREILPMTLVGTDGGLLESPQTITEVFLSPAERIDVIVDLRDRVVGEELFLKTLNFFPMENMRTAEQEMLTSSTRIYQGESYNLLKLKVTEAMTQRGDIPSQLSTIERIEPTGAGIITLNYDSADYMQWEINGTTFKMDEHPVTVQRETAEVWEVRNGHMSIPHPLHIHGPQFQVISRLYTPSQAAQFAVDDRGRMATDLGYKDTIMVWPGEYVRLAMGFFDMYEGDQTLLMHCHILEHEDMGMMINFKVE